MRHFVHKRITPETAEKKAIQGWLALNNFFTYYNLAGMAVYPGISDLTTISPRGNVYQIEVKTSKGKQSRNQELFQKNWEANNGNYIIGDYDKVINEIKKREGEFNARKQDHSNNPRRGVMQ